MKSIGIIMTSILISLFSCKKDDKLTISKKPYLGNQLRTDGYYYTEFENKMHNISFFYKNGIYLDIGSALNDFKDTNNYIINKFINERNHIDSKIGWGVFNIENDNIAFEKWYPSAKPYKAFVRAGKILNDTTFVITESYRAAKGRREEINIINTMYHFKKFSPKPDSSNVFVP